MQASIQSDTPTRNQRQPADDRHATRQPAKAIPTRQNMV